MLSVSKDELNSALRHFHNVTGIKIVVYDTERRVIMTYPESFEPYCTVVRSSATLAKRCLDCDGRGFDECDRTGKPHIYKCHMNITEAIAPVYAGKVIIGYLMFGQVLCREDEEAAYLASIETAKCFNFDSDDFLKKLRDIKRATPNYLVSALQIMCMCAGYLYTSEIIKNSTDVLAHQVREYIDRHISDKLSSGKLCAHFYISRSKLYKISVSEFGMGISEYIREQRLQLAAQKLSQTASPIAQIAAETGIQDANYFVRTFKARFGLTPLKYRLAMNAAPTP